MLYISHFVFLLTFSQGFSQITSDILGKDKVGPGEVTINEIKTISKQAEHFYQDSWKLQPLERQDDSDGRIREVHRVFPGKCWQ